MQTRVEQVGENQVRLEVEVDEHEVDHAFEHAAADLAESVRIPGFRRGKSVPIPVLVARVGQDALAAEAVRSHVEGWFWSAAADSRIRPVAEPRVEWPELPRQGARFSFSAEVEVMPKPRIAEWRGLQVPGADSDVPPALVEAEIDRLRTAAAALARADRPARAGDTLVLDLDGREHTAGYVVELGDGRLLDELEQALVGASSGDEKSVELEVDGERETLRVTLREVQEKLLPDADDTFARDATEFESLAELRDDIEGVLREQLEAEVDTQFREAALDTLAAASTFEQIDMLVRARMRTLWDGMLRSLARRGVRPETYLAMTGQTPQQVEERLQAEAERSVKRELTLEAVAEQLELSVSDDEVEAYVRAQADLDDDADGAVAALRVRGWETLRSDLRFRKALDEIVAGVERIPVELHRAREQLWTPEKEKAGSDVKIWTPGSEERTR